MTPEQIIKRPLILTEKGNRLREQEQPSTSSRSSDARTRSQIRNAIETLFNVKVAERQHADRARPDAPHGPRLRQDPELEEGDRRRSRRATTIDFFEGA